MPVKLNVRTVIGLVSAIVVGVVVANWWKRVSYEGEVFKRVTATRHRLPRPVQPGIVQTTMELDGHVLKSRYEVGTPVGDLMFETDPESAARFAKNITTTICEDPQYVDLLEHGYSFDRVYEIFTPHGPDAFHVVTTAADCPGVVVKK